MMTDPIADMLTRIRNANRIEKPAVEMPATYLKTGVARVLKEEGFILDFQLGSYQEDAEGNMVFQPVDKIEGAKALLRVFLKYGPDGERVIRKIQRVSTPGSRVYSRSAKLRPVLDGMGIAVISTSKGVMSDRRARAERVGGEVLCTVW